MAVYIPQANRQPHLFLSHSSVDKEFVRKLAYDLAVCEVDVWLDEWEIGAGDSIYKAISEGIKSSKYVALIISKSFLDSRWGSEEVESAFARQIDQNQKVIIPIQLENVEMPVLLRGKLYLSFWKNYYQSLAKLAAIIHEIDLKILSQALVELNPNSLKEAVDVLAYCGLDPYMIIPKDVFSELALLKGVEVHDTRLRFQDLNMIYNNPDVSKRAKFYLQRVWTGNEKQNRWLH